jgi:hypothetical protein
LKTDQSSIISCSDAAAAPGRSRLGASHKHKSIVCLICDQFIVWMETIYYLSKDRISEHSNRLSVKSYKRYYGIELKTEARNQYLINDENLKDL